MLKASHSHTNRAALSAESWNSTPPFCIGLLATNPVTAPPRRPNPTTNSLANSGLASIHDPSSTSARITLRMSYALRSSSGIIDAVSGVTGSTLAIDAGRVRQLSGMNENHCLAMAIASASSLARKSPQPLVVTCIRAPPISSSVVISPVTISTIRGEPRYIEALPSTMTTTSQNAGM